MPFKMHKIIFCFPEKKDKEICVPTLPEIFRPVTRNTLIFFFGLGCVSARQDEGGCDHERRGDKAITGKSKKSRN